MERRECFPTHSKWLVLLWYENQNLNLTIYTNLIFLIRHDQFNLSQLDESNLTLKNQLINLTIFTNLKKKKPCNHLEIHRESIWQNSTFIHNKNSQYAGNIWKFHKLDKDTYGKPMTNIIFNGERLKSFPSFENKARRIPSQYIINIALALINSVIRWGKKITGT